MFCSIHIKFRKRTLIMSSQVVGNYRFLLKHVKSLPSTQNWKGHVISKFKAGISETDPSTVKHLRELSNQYTTMIRSINELKYLRNLDTGEKLDPRDKIRATAGRVGLSVPRFADDPFHDEVATATQTKSNESNMNA